MSENATGRNDTADVAAEARSMLAEGVQAAREKGAEVGRRAASQIDSRRDAFAGGLEGVAQGIRGGADAVTKAGTSVSGLAHGAAERLASTARYVREHKTDELFAQVEDLVRAHPGKSLLAAVAIGFIAGRALRRD